MPGPYIAGTFTTGTSTAVLGNVSDTLVPGTVAAGKQMKLTLTGCDASNTCRTEKRTTPGGAWSPVTTYNSNQNGTLVTVATNEEWRLAALTAQAQKSLQYVMDAQS